MVTSPGRHVGGGAPRARERATADRAVRGGLGGVPPDRRARRPARGQLDVGDGKPPADGLMAPGRGRRRRRARAVDLRRASLGDVRGLDLRVPDRATRGPMRPRSGTAWRRPGPASTRRPGICRAPRRRTPVGRTGRWPSTSATSPTGRSSRSTTSGPRRPDRSLAVGRRLRRRRLRPLQRAPPRAVDDDAARRRSSPDFGRPRPRLLEAAAPAPARHAPRATTRGAGCTSTLHGHYLDHLAVIEPWTDSLRDRQIDGDPFIADPRAGGPRRSGGGRAAHRRALRRARPQSSRRSDGTRPK